MTQYVPLEDNREFKILDIQDGRCTNLNRLDKVFLIAFMSMDGMLQTDITVVVKNQGMLLKAIPPVNEGYNATILCGRFTNRANDQVMLSLRSGYGGGQTFHYLFDFFSPEISILFDAKNINLQSYYRADFCDGYKVIITNELTKEKHLIDLKYKQKVYLKSIYDENGTLKEGTSGEIHAIRDMLPVYSEEFKRFQLLAYQRITGLNNTDTLGYLVTRLNWNGFEFHPIDVYTTVMPLKRQMQSN